MSENYGTEFTNMIMIEDGNGNVLVQERIKYWKGIAFPGGHAEPGESFMDSAVREVKEETGLDVRNLRLCGIIHWDNPEKREKYIVLAYKTGEFSGVLKEATDEGRVFWVKKEKLPGMQLCNNFERYLEFFMNDTAEEFYDIYN